MEIRVGVLALQGAFLEHERLLSRVTLPGISLLATPVRTPEELAQCDAVILPGGESTSMARIARATGLLEPLRAFVRDQGKAAWGTCAGMILLADEVEEGSVKKGGQDLIGGLPIRVVRNQFGRQIESFEEPLRIPGLSHPDEPFNGIFIRAPIMHTLLDGEAQVLAALPAGRLPLPNEEQLPLGPDATIVAIRKGRLMATSFHPELTSDPRLHELFIKNCVLQSS